jgi:3-isopropylmalate/(R)-2-methylmalate dehydratase small subunit
VPADIHAALLRSPGAIVKIDLNSQTLTLPDGTAVEFPIDAFSKHCLLAGVDELGYILNQDAAISAYEAQRVGSINTLA